MRDTERVSAPPARSGPPVTSASTPSVAAAESVRFSAQDGARLRGSLHHAREPVGIVVLSGATAVPHGFYRRFAEALAGAGLSTLTYDYRGVGASRPRSGLSGYPATMSDWALRDLPAAVDWASARLGGRVFLLGHSFGGQVAGLLPDPDRVASMVTVSSQSGYWRAQRGWQPLAVGLHMHLTVPLAARTLGYVPWSRVASGEDLPAGVGRQWAAWCRDPAYLLGDPSLPVGRYAGFGAPVLAYSIEDDEWGSASSVRRMMRAYPNVTYRHLVPAERGLGSVGHMGFFRPAARSLWGEVTDWFVRGDGAG